MNTDRIIPPHEAEAAANDLTVPQGAAATADIVPAAALAGHPPHVGRYRWIVCALLFFATTINYIDRQILSLIKPILDEQLHWTDSQFGLVNSAFQGAYGVSLLIFGWLVDRFGTKIGYALSIGAWSVMAMSHALVGSVGGFIAARVGLGLGEGGNFPSAIKAVALWFPRKERALATSIFNSGSNVGAIIAPAIVPWVALTWGWHMAFILAGVAGMLWLLFWLPFYNVPEKIAALTAAERDYIDSDREPHEASVPWGSLLRYRQTWSFLVAKFVTDPVWWFFLIWLPDFFKKTYHLDIKKSWDKLVTIYAIITVLSILGGWVTGYLARCGWTVTRARKTGMLIFAFCVVPVMAATKVSVWPAVLLIALAGAAHQAWSANLYTTVSDMFPKSAVASVTGMGGLAGAIGGMIYPLYCGHVLDVFKARGNESGAYANLLLICAFAYVATFAVHHLLAPRFERFAFAEK
ncbi:MAG TPA: MFS transporter [Chthoniobacteraceae bacterium]|nr:MFS transporter [Chthoniobacteraceae bacterium]